MSAERAQWAVIGKRDESGKGHPTEGAPHPILGGDGRLPGGGYNQVRTDWWNKLAGKGGAEAQEGIAHHFGMAAVERERGRVVRLRGPWTVGVLMGARPEI